jgi:hypothetical protein
MDRRSDARAGIVSSLALEGDGWVVIDLNSRNGTRQREEDRAAPRSITRT